MELKPAPGGPDSHEVADYRPVLNEILGLAAELSRIIVQRAAAETPTPMAEAAAAFDRVTTGMRRTILLLRHLDGPAKPSASQHRVAARKRILRDVEDAIDIAFDDRSRPIAETEKADLRLELLDRLDSPDTEEAIAGRPVEDIVNEICRDLHVRHQDTRQRGRRRTPADVDALNARVAKPPVAKPPVAKPPAAKPWGESGDPTPPARHREDETPELMSLNDIILRHVADASPGFPGHDSGQSPRAAPW